MPKVHKGEDHANSQYKGRPIHMCIRLQPIYCGHPLILKPQVMGPNISGLTRHLFVTATVGLYSIYRQTVTAIHFKLRDNIHASHFQCSAFL